MLCIRLLYVSALAHLSSSARSCELSDVGMLTKPQPATIVTSSLGCSMSTAVDHLALQLLCAHGIRTQVGTNGKFDMLKPSVKGEPNPLYNPENGDRAAELMIVAAMERARSRGATLFFKVNPGMRDDANRPGLVRAAPLTVVLFRQNVLDVAVCRIRDCFGTKATPGHPFISPGEPVFANGTSAELCFSRRRKHDHPTFAKFNMDRIVQTLEFPMNVYEQQVLEAKKWALNKDLLSVSTESLLAFEFSNTTVAMEHSIQAWSSVLEAWTITPNLTTIREIFTSQWGTHRRYSHESVIYNHLDVYNALLTNPALNKFSQHWRS
eukprot:m.36331 g.36331  ORF g.36331 m.36331 type:complete len:323 (-) comp17336_c0_seq1:515-1483(-)